MPKCNFCDCVLANEYSLATHQKTAKKCLIKQGIVLKGDFKCDLCEETFTLNSMLTTHKVSCSKKYNTELKKKNLLLESKLLELKSKLLEVQNKYNMIVEEKKEWKIEKEKLLDKITTAALSKTSYFEHETTIDIDIDEDESDTESDDDSDSEEYKLTPLELGNGYTIEHRDEDGFINVTNLCKAGGKQFKHWKSIEKTKGFLRVLSSSVGHPTDELIKYNTGGNSERATWAHPQVAINIAQWISPNFDVKVSSWVYEVMMTGKVDITNTKSYKELQKENKNKDIKIQFLTKKYVKSQPRVQYDEKNVIYILTTKLMKKERRYILGKAVDLTSRLSTYNKSDEHEVIFFGSCKDVETMNVVENMVFTCLNEYREQANRERFVLPENEKIELFSNAIKKSIEFFK
jgi:hypothetical protein